MVDTLEKEKNAASTARGRAADKNEGAKNFPVKNEFRSYPFQKRKGNWVRQVLRGIKLQVGLEWGRKKN